MKKLFISQPMRDKTKQEILKERQTAIDVVQNILGEDVEVIDTLFNFDDNPLYCLGNSIAKMSEADIVYFCENWQHYRGCRVEHFCAVEYGLTILRYTSKGVVENGI